MNVQITTSSSELEYQYCFGLKYTDMKNWNCQGQERNGNDSMAHYLDYMPLNPSEIIFKINVGSN